MGNKWGVIHNQTTQGIIYILHSSQLMPFSQTIKKSAQIGVTGDVVKGQIGANVKASVQNQLLKQQVKNDGVYTLPPGRIGTQGLSKVDFDQVKFWTIVTVDGKYIIKNGKITCNQDIRVRISKQDYLPKALNQKQSEDLKQLATGGTVANSNCSICKEKADYRQVQKKMLCRSCNHQFKTIWSCRNNPIYHSYCQNCHRNQNGMNQFQSKLDA